MSLWRVQNPHTARNRMYSFVRDTSGSRAQLLNTLAHTDGFPPIPSHWVQWCREDSQVEMEGWGAPNSKEQWDARQEELQGQQAQWDARHPSEPDVRPFRAVQAQIAAARAKVEADQRAAILAQVPSGSLAHHWAELLSQHSGVPNPAHTPPLATT